jgi:hypothetical protein
VAVDLVSKEEYGSKIWCLVVENTFSSIPDMAKVLLGWRLLQYFPLCFYKNKVCRFPCRFSPVNRRFSVRVISENEALASAHSVHIGHGGHPRATEDDV